MEYTLDQTLDRIRGGNIEDSWWRGLLRGLGQSYVAPDFLRQPALQAWLREDQVADDLKTLATAKSWEEPATIQMFVNAWRDVSLTERAKIPRQPANQ